MQFNRGLYYCDTEECYPSRNCLSARRYYKKNKESQVMQKTSIKIKRQLLFLSPSIMAIYVTRCSRGDMTCRKKRIGELIADDKELGNQRNYSKLNL